MPKRNFSQGNFILGMNDFQDPRHLEDGECAYLDKFHPDRHGILRNYGSQNEITGTNLTNHTLALNSNGAAGRCLFFFSSDYDDGTAFATPGEVATNYIMVADRNNGNIDVYDFGTDAWDGAHFSYGGGAGAVTFMMGGGHVRVGNAALHGSNRNMRWGVYKKERFWNTSSSEDYTIDNWLATNCKLQKPTGGKALAVSSSYTTHTVSSAYGIPSIDVWMEKETDTTKVEAEWEKRWRVGVTLVYDGNQESLIRTLTSVLDYEDDNVSGIKFNIRVAGGDGASNERIIDPRLTHAKVYIKEVGTEEWFLQAVFDFQKGGSVPYDEPVTSTTGWTKGGADSANSYYNAVHSEEYQERPNVRYTYFSENGYHASEEAVDIGLTGEGWATGIVTNNRAYVANVRVQRGEEKNIESDSIYRSEVNQFDKFVASRQLITSGSDGEAIIRLMAFGDYLLEFKQRTLRVINVSGEDPFVEATFQSRGIPHYSSVTNTDYGVVWANRYGVFMFGKNGLVNLLERKGKRILSDATWDNVSDDGSGNTTQLLVGYLPNEKEVLVFRSSTALAGHMIRIDLISTAISYGSNVINNVRKTNFINNEKGELIWAEANSSVIDFYKWNPTPAATSTALVRFKDDFFEADGLRKFVYGVTVRYKSSVDRSSPMEYGINGTAPSAAIGAGDFDTKTNWFEQWFPLETKVDCESFQVQCDPNESGTTEIAAIRTQARVLIAGRIKTTYSSP